MMTRLLFTVVLLTLLLGAQARAQNMPPVVGIDQVYEQARDAMWWGDFEALERMHALYQQPAQRLSSEGRSTLAAVRRGLASPVGPRLKAGDGYFKQVDDLTLQWAKDHPNSAVAHVLHAGALRRHGLAHRGGEFASKVPEEAWREFKRYVDAAIAYLLRHERVAFQASVAYVELIELGRLAGWGLPQLWAVASRGLAAFPHDEGMMSAMVTAVVPRWGGDDAVLDRMINDLVKPTREAHGDIYYARLYALAAAEEYGAALFKESRVDWRRMKAGYLQLVERHPAAVNLNEFAYHACMARDKPALRDLLVRVGPKPLTTSWGVNGLRTFESCKRFAAEL